MDEHTYEVDELARRIAGAVEVAFPAELWVRGEIRNLSRAAAGHVYFDLIGGGAVLPVVLFASTRRAVNRHLIRSGAGRMSDGVEVRIRGFAGFYERTGQVQLRMTRIDPDYTVGRLAAARERLVRALAADGSLRRNASLPFPLVPLRVGLVTSAASAAATDFLHELEASGFGFQVALVDARVQGRDAERSLCAGLQTLAGRPLDVVAVVRGGGSRLDLAAFDAEAVARAIADFPIPVLTGIGHEVDETIADRVAAGAFKTPTACAAGLVTTVRQFLATADAAWTGVSRAAGNHLAAAPTRLSDHGIRVARSARHGLRLAESGLHGAAARLRQAAARRTATAPALLAADAARLELAVRARLRADRKSLDGPIRRLAAAGRRGPARASRLLDEAAVRVRVLDPARTLARGWTITRTGDGTLVGSAAEISAGTTLITSFADGRAVSEVTDVHVDGSDGVDRD